MCHQDAVDCLADGRKNAYKYFKKLVIKSEATVICKNCGTICRIGGVRIKNVPSIGRLGAREKQIQALASREIREKSVILLTNAKR